MAGWTFGSAKMAVIALPLWQKETRRNAEVPAFRQENPFKLR
jgi:hypothetical protein